jgi:HD superfamily phosphohydrolase
MLSDTLRRDNPEKVGAGMSAESFSISDPLYELNLFGVGRRESPWRYVFSGGKGTRDLALYRELISTFELNRLNFLKQAGLLFLIFPSATHTRFAHSLGTLTLGTYALEHIWVKRRGTSRPMKLETYLEDSEGLEEFLLALLLHDIGHLPFSHYLEASPKIRSTFVKHERISARLLDSRDDLHKTLRRKARALGTQTVVDVCRDNKKIDLGRVIDLLDEQHQKTDPVAQLVSGPLDMDRLDHYNRDSYFMGLKLSNVNVRGFLGSIVLDIRDNQLKLRPEGVQHALNLLFSKEMLWQRALDTEYSRSYEAMFNRVVDIWLNDARIKELPFMREEELLGDLYEQPRLVPILNRIFCRRPYPQLIAKATTVSESEITNRFKEWSKLHASEDDDFIMFLPSGFGSRDVGTEWLSEHIPIIDESEAADKQRFLRDAHGSLFDYFRKQQQARIETFRIFAKDERIVDAKREAANSFF